MLGLRLFLLLSTPVDAFARGGYSNCSNGGCDIWAFLGVILIGFVISGSVADIYKDKPTTFERMLPPAIGVFITGATANLLICTRDPCLYFVILLCCIFISILFLLNRVETQNPIQTKQFKRRETEKSIPRSKGVDVALRKNENKIHNESLDVVSEKKNRLSVATQEKVTEVTETPDPKKIYCPTCNRQYDPRYFFKSTKGDDFSQCRVCKTDVKKSSRLLKKLTRLESEKIYLPNSHYCHVCNGIREFAESEIGPSWGKCSTCKTHIQSSSTSPLKS